MMDGIIHNLARKQKLKAQPSPKRRPSDQSPNSPMLEGTFMISEESPERPMTEYFPPRPLLSPRKGILKSPTVHFPEELGPVADDPVRVSPSTPQHPSATISHSLPVESTQILALPPPPPPPPPPPIVHPAPPPPPPINAPEPPTLFNREIEANEYLNEAAYKLYTKFIDELSEFVDQQGEVIRMRLQVQEKRADLKRLREEVSQCDMLLINHVRQGMTSGIPSNDATMISLFEAAQAARDLVGPKELDYEPLEVGLGAAEHKLKEKYANIENKFEHFFRLNATSTTKQSLPSKIEYERSTNSSVSKGFKEWTGLEPRDTGLLYGTFIGEQVGIGQTPLRMEQGLTEMLPRQEPPVHKMPPPSTDTADLSKKHRSSMATIDDKPGDEPPASLLGIAGIEGPDISQSQEIETRDRRISQSLKGVAYHSIIEVSDEQISLLDDLPLDSDLLDGGDLLVLEEQMDKQSIFSDYLASFDNTRDRVNRWILHQLRVSPREVYALGRVIRESSPELSGWAVHVLKEWPNDMLGHGQSYHQGSIEDESDDMVVGHHITSPHPVLEPLELLEPLHHKLPSAGTSNVALAPTTSDIHDRTLSIQADLPDLISALQTVAAV